MYPQPNLNFSEQWRNGQVSMSKIKVIFLEELLLLSLLSSSLPRFSVEGENGFLASSDVETVLDTSTDKELFYLAAVSITLSHAHSSQDSCFNKKQFKTLSELRKVPRLKHVKATAFNSVHDLVVFSYRRCKYLFKPKLRTLVTNRDVFNFYKRIFQGAYQALLQWYGKDFEDLQVKSLLSVLMKQHDSETLYRLMPEN